MILYKYLPPARMDVLENLKIRYSQPGAFNDPFEVKPYISHISDDEQIERGIDQVLDDEVRKLYEKLPSQVRSAFFLEQVVGLVKQRRESLRGQFGGLVNSFTPRLREIMEEKFNELLGILSLSENPTSLLMWSHYSQNHEGFLIGFDVAHSHFNEKRSEKDEFGYVRKVEYRQKRPNAALTAMDAVEVFLVKAAEWAYEHEWRVLRPLPNASQIIEAEGLPVCLFSFPPECVAEITIGARASSKDYNMLLSLVSNLASERSIRIYKAKLSEMEFKVERQQITI
ncbi:DUF2971 domain-containing protein [Billgrantia ethanolica]|uniref:DUF2971 domain-containing protein n=1 Tax=Billgrantia ethanolica TaxID=2733486 RepID=A0ABS8ZZ97_9GAMM|nr:DUF2971 domain-containing protein [Halomonas ethanolica]MCE8001851.1 DUF2971 domain-containing protein [Halomonas ethanolica]